MKTLLIGLTALLLTTGCTRVIVQSPPVTDPEAPEVEQTEDEARR